MASKLKLARIKADLSQTKLADIARNYQGRVSRIERGDRPKQDEADRIAKALGLRPEELFDELRK